MLPALSILYTRFDAASLLDSPPRRALLDVIARAPGLRIGDAARALAVDYKTAVHHVRMLSRAGHVVVREEGRERRCYLPGARPARAPRAVAALHALDAGAATPSALGRALGIPRGTAGSLLAALVERGLAHREGGRYGLAPAAREALAPRERFS